MAFFVDDFHPMRFLRQFPAAWLIVRQEARECPRGLLTAEAFHRVTEFTMHAYNRALDRIPFEKRPTNVDALVSVASTISHIIAFAAAGRNSFVIDQYLVGLLSKTDLKDIRLSDIQLPFRAFYVGFAGGLPFGLPGEPNIIDGAYVEQYGPSQDDTLGQRLSFYLTTRRTDGPHRGYASWIIGHEPHFFVPLTLDPTADTLEDAIERAVSTKDIALQVDHDALRVLNAGIDQAKADGFAIGATSISGYERKALYNQAAIPTVKTVVATLCNVLCLLASKPTIADAEWPVDAPLSLVQLVTGASTPKRRRTAIGRLVEAGYFSINRLVMQLGPADHAGELLARNEPADREVEPHWRRGHWRRQRFGADLKNCRLVWIRPILVRSDRGLPQAGHLYSVKLN